jgi:hypothetical protein
MHWKPRAKTITVPEEDMMGIPLKLGWENQNMFTNVYQLSLRDKEVDKTFGRLHEQDKVEWSANLTPFGFLVFVSRRPDKTGSLKPRVVVDIRGLNRLVIPDAYP